MTVEDMRNAVAGAIDPALDPDGPPGDALAPPPSASTIPPPAPGTDQPFDLWLARQDRSDIGNAKRFIARHGCDLIWLRNAGWLSWNGKWWQGKAAGARDAELRAQATAEAMEHEASAIARAGKYKGEKDDDFEERKDRAWKWKRTSANSGRISAMLELAAPRLEKMTEEVDARPFLFNVQNGTLELGPLEPDGTVQVNLRPHDRRDLITRGSPVVYDPNATKCPLWRGALDYFLPDREVQVFLQRWYGYGMTDSIVEQSVVLQHGHGSNFKSTMVEAISRVMGGYADSVPIETLVSNERRRGGDPSPDLAKLPGIRVLTAAEPARSVPLNESLIKQMTGGESLTVRHLHKDFFNFKPTFKLVISFNRAPKIRGDDDGIWRRLIVVNFPVKISKAERDKEFGEKLRDEYPAILNWMIDGYRMWREKGLVIPKAVQESTDRYRRESDTVGQFIDAACLITSHRNDTTPAIDMWDAYKVWCGRNAADQLSRTGFGRMLSEREGIVKDRLPGDGSIRYCGVRLIDQSLLAGRHAEERRSDARTMLKTHSMA